MKSAVFLYNTQSGKCKIERCTEAVCTVFRAYGYEITPQPIDFEANPFDGNEQIDLMVVAGGDGTVNEIANGIAGFPNAAMTCIPIGTGNDFLKNFGKDAEPLFLDAENLWNGDVTPLDLIDCNGKYCLTIACTGIDLSLIHI